MTREELQTYVAEECDFQAKLDKALKVIINPDDLDDNDAPDSYLAEVGVCYEIGGCLVFPCKWNDDEEIFVLVGHPDGTFTYGNLIVTVERQEGA